MCFCSVMLHPLGSAWYAQLEMETQVKDSYSSCTGVAFLETPELTWLDPERLGNWLDSRSKTRGQSLFYGGFFSVCWERLFLSYLASLFSLSAAASKPRKFAVVKEAPDRKSPCGESGSFKIKYDSRTLECKFPQLFVITSKPEGQQSVRGSQRQHDTMDEEKCTVEVQKYITLYTWHQTSYQKGFRWIEVE